MLVPGMAHRTSPALVIRRTKALRTKSRERNIYVTLIAFEANRSDPYAIFPIISPLLPGCLLAFCRVTIVLIAEPLGPHTQVTVMLGMNRILILAPSGRVYRPQELARIRFNMNCFHVFADDAGGGSLLK